MKKINSEFLDRVQEMEYEDYIDEVTEECIHDIVSTINGIFVCDKCGSIFGSVLDSDFLTITNKMGVRVYERRKYLRDLMNRVSGLSFKETKAVDIDKIPSTISEIRKYLYKNKLHKLNDYYYWRIKNNITQQVLRKHMMEYEQEFRQTRNITQRDFLRDKFNKKPEYKVFVPLFTRKKILNQTQSKDC